MSPQFRREPNIFKYRSNYKYVERRQRPIKAFVLGKARLVSQKVKTEIIHNEPYRQENHQLEGKK